MVTVLQKVQIPYAIHDFAVYTQDKDKEGAKNLRNVKKDMDGKGLNKTRTYSQQNLGMYLNKRLVC